MTINYEMRYDVHPSDYPGYSNRKLNDTFRVSRVFVPDEINLIYTTIDRFIVGGACPVNKPLPLDVIEPLKADYFLDRRELGVIDVGGAGTVTVDDTVYDLGNKDALYIGAGAKNVVFASIDSADPAKFYLNSACAHKELPCKMVSLDVASKLHLGTVETSNKRTVNQMMINNVVETCQLQMGLTALETGSVWNTMPAHTHGRRNEVYFYFDLPADQAVCHFMGSKEETRHLWIGNEEAVISPTWSIHAGAGTTNYAFIWGMAGENLDYSDMDLIHPADFVEAGRRK